MLTKQPLTDFLKKIMACGLLIGVTAILAGGNDRSNAELIQEVYIVKSGDTLWSISDKYMQKNDYDPRDIREFISGIIELNYNETFKNRDGNHHIYPGDQLKINYWVRDQRNVDLR